MVPYLDIVDCIIERIEAEQVVNLRKSAYSLSL